MLQEAVVGGCYGSGSGGYNVSGYNNGSRYNIGGYTVVARSTLHKQLCGEFGGKSQLCLDYILGPFDI